jgi:hypothetical protein
MRNAYKILLRKPEGKRPVERTRRRWENNIKMALGGIWWGGVDWIHLAQDTDQWLALVNTIISIWVPQKVRNF